jgi:NAD(P)-dependent dehydrogenase (short-subunit alcohol dehydrogenase family)
MMRGDVQTPGNDIAVVTGASQGIGQALLAALSRRGAAVAGISRSTFAPDPSSVLALAADITDPRSLAEAFGEIRARLGIPTILINCAEVYPHRDVLDETPESFMNTVRINLGGTFNCCHAVLPDMVALGRGRIINIATFADIDPAPMAAGYSVSKGGVRILTRSLVADLGDRFPGIVINDWVPGSHIPRRGIPDGVDPLVAAEWGASLALIRDPAINGRVFLRDREYIPFRTLKRKVRDQLLGVRRSTIRLG